MTRSAAAPPAVTARREARLVGRLLAGAGWATLAAVPFLALMLLVRSESESLERVDRGVADELNAWALDRPTAVSVLDVLADVFAPWTFRALVLVAAVLLWRVGSWLLATWALTTMAIGGILGVVLKELVERARPTFPEPVATASHYSFPSGHALNSMLGAAVLLLIALPLLRGLGRVLAWVAAAAAVLVTGFDRVALGVHFVSDVLAGWVIALALCVGTTVAFGSWRHGRRPAAEGADPAGSRRLSGSPPDAASVG